MISVIVGCCQHTRSWIWYKLGCFLIVQGEKESYQGELFEHAALAVYVGWLSGGHLSDLWREQFDLGKTIFSHFQQCRASRQMWCSVTFCKGVRWTFFWGSVEISDYLDNLWHLLIHWERWWWWWGGTIRQVQGENTSQRDGEKCSRNNELLSIFFLDYHLRVFKSGKATFKT